MAKTKKATAAKKGPKNKSPRKASRKSVHWATARKGQKRKCAGCGKKGHNVRTCQAV